MDDVDPMGHEVCQTATAEIPVVPPLIEALRPEGLVGRRAKPTLPIELVHRNRRVVAGPGVLIPVRLDERNLAQPARVDDLLPQHPVLPAPLLGAGLHDLLRRLDHLDHLRALGNRVRDRLLDVDVLSGRHGVERHGLVPVIGRADHDGVDLAIVEDAAVVCDLGGSGPGDLGGLEHARLIHVADGDQLVARQPLQMVHEAACPAACADHPDADSVVRALGLRRRHAGPEREPGGSGKECATVADHVSLSCPGAS